MSTPQRTFVVMAAGIGLAVVVEVVLLALLVFKASPPPAVREVEPPSSSRLVLPTPTPPSAPAATVTVLGITLAVWLVFVLVAGYLVLTFIPVIIAFQRGHHNAPAILAVTLLIGWTFLGWVAALVWALSNPPPQPVTIINERA